MVIALVVLSILLAVMTCVTLMYKSDASFWEALYRSLNKTCDELVEQNSRVIEACQKDLKITREVLDDNQKLVNMLKEWNSNADKYELKPVEDKRIEE